VEGENGGLALGAGDGEGLVLEPSAHIDQNGRIYSPVLAIL
jgi:hypothetical protein